MAARAAQGRALILGPRIVTNFRVLLTQGRRLTAGMFDAASGTAKPKLAESFPSSPMSQFIGAEK
jgi:hypothetical protein